MKNINIKGTQNLTLAVILAVMILPVIAAVIINNIMFIIFGVCCFAAGLIDLAIVFNKDRYLPLSFKIKKRILMGVVFKVEIVLAKIFKVSTENIMQYFILLNNRLNPETRVKKMLLLLPRCIQDSGCRRDLVPDINNCLKCGKCQVADIIKIADPKKIEIRLVGGGTLALEKIKEVNPEGIIAVACERDLIEGIKETFNVPVWAIANLRPNGPCLNTKIYLDELEKILDKHS